MFVRFRSTSRRLELALAETRRIGGKVKQEHVASLGSIPLPLTVDCRIAFWAKLHARLARLANRISAEAHDKILGVVQGQANGEVATAGGDITKARSPGLASYDDIGISSQRVSEWRQGREEGEA